MIRRLFNPAAMSSKSIAALEEGKRWMYDGRGREGGREKEWEGGREGGRQRAYGVGFYEGFMAINALCCA